MRAPVPAAVAAIVAGAVAAASIATGGCVQRSLRVDRGELHAHVPALRADGRARVELEGGGAAWVEVGQLVEVDGRRVTVGALIEHCPDVAPFREDRFRRDPPCRLTDARTVVLGRERRPDWVAIRFGAGATLGGTGLAFLGSTAYCAVTCEELGRDGALIGVGLGLGLVVAGILVAPR